MGNLPSATSSSFFKINFISVNFCFKLKPNVINYKTLLKKVKIKNQHKIA